MAKPHTTKAKKKKRVVSEGRACIYASFNNTVVTITDMQGAVLTWSTAGKVGHKGSRKSTPFAAQQAANDAAKAAIEAHSLEAVDVIVSGVGPGRESAVKGLAATGLRIKAITDATGIPHNGCRPPKRRRV